VSSPTRSATCRTASAAKRLLVAGYTFYGLVYVGFALARKPGLVWLLFALYGVFQRPERRLGEGPRR